MTLTTFNTDVQTADGLMDCFVAHPEGGGPHPGVIIYMDVPGIRRELELFAERIAGEGYTAVLPDLYYRDGKVRFDLSKGGEEFKRMFAQGQKMTNAMVVSDSAGILSYLQQADFASTPVGIIGYCMSGQFILSVAGSHPEVQAGASLYGTRMVTEAEDSPHLLIPQISGELYLGFAEKDHYVEDFVIPRLQEDLDKHGTAYNLEIHPGTDHGFCFPERPQYVEAAAELVWDRVFEMFARRLKN